MISIWFWSHLSVVITVLIVLGVLGYALLLWIAVNDLKEYKDWLREYDHSDK